MIQYLTSLFFIVCILLVSSCKQQEKHPVSYEGLIHDLNFQLTNAIKADGFSPPVASRIYAYCNICLYECAILGESNYASLNGQLQGFSYSALQSTRTMDSRALTVNAFYYVAKEFIYDTLSLSLYIDSLNKVLINEIEDDEKYTSSIAASRHISEAVISYSRQDGYKEIKQMPLYEYGDSPSSYQATPPNYYDAIEPNWALLKPFVLDSTSQFFEPFPIAFDTLPGSKFYLLNKAIYDTTKNLSKTFMDLALFWDCNPLTTINDEHNLLKVRQITPGGHWINIVKIIGTQKNSSPTELADVYLRVSLALAEAFKVSWYSKYNTNLIRPETYINQYIDKTWKPFIETPPFPEHNSGHALISNAAAHTLAFFYGNQIEYTDNTNDPYGLEERKFSLITDASAEASISRYYGGIHYYESIVQGENQGKEVAELLEARLITLKSKF